jgi:Putative Actinobacterial Holin-X, holin superfamily III
MAMEGGHPMAEVRREGEDSTLGDRSIAELVKQLSDQSATLVRQEVDLAKAELAVKGKQAGIGAGMFGGAGVFGLYAVGALTACVILALATVVTAWLAAFIAAAVYGAIAGVLALRGRTKLQQGVPPVPEQAVESVKEDVQWTKQRAKEGRQ